MMTLRRVALCAAVGAASVLAGCTVSVPVVDKGEALDAGRERLARVYAEQAPSGKALDLPDAVARALLYNLDYRAATMTAAVADADLARSSYALWPQLALGAGYSARDSFAAAVSRDPITGAQTLQPSVSSEKQSTTGQLQLSWNALDFGVGYLRAKQKGNAALMAEEQRRKAFQGIVQEVTIAWWRALAAQRMEPRLTALRERVESALDRSQQMEEQRLQAPLAVLDYRRDLLLSLKRLAALQEEVLNARNQLARLVSLPAGTTLALVEPAALAEPAWLPLALSGEQLERIALANRPELRDLEYRQRMAGLEGKIAVASLMPSFNIATGARHDSNKFLVNNDWNDTSAQFSFNLLNLAALPAARRYGKAAKASESLRADAMTLAVVSQLGIALRAIESDRQGWCMSRELERVAGQREEQYRARAASSAGNELTQIRAEVEAVLTGLESAFSFAELSASHALLLNTLGMDPYPENLEKGSADEVATQLRAYFAQGLGDRMRAEAAALKGAASGQSPALTTLDPQCMP